MLLEKEKKNQLKSGQIPQYFGHITDIFQHIFNILLCNFIHPIPHFLFEKEMGNVFSLMFNFTKFL